jgi:hypothetical protein
MNKNIRLKEQQKKEGKPDFCLKFDENLISLTDPLVTFKSWGKK